MRKPDYSIGNRPFSKAMSLKRLNLCKPTLPGGVVQQGWVQGGLPQGHEDSVRRFKRDFSLRRFHPTIDAKSTSDECTLHSS